MCCRLCVEGLRGWHSPSGWAPIGATTFPNSPGSRVSTSTCTPRESEWIGIASVSIGSIGFPVLEAVERKKNSNVEISSVILMGTLRGVCYMSLDQACSRYMLRDINLSIESVGALVV